jgi:hypothetical protein
LPLNAALQQVHKILFLVSIILIMHVVINKEDCCIGALEAAT